ncbi:MAG: ATP-dependent DNA helicase RecG [Bacteroidales bacterium]|jgi:ATP-dependent DNA helicase RecG|nr:ATP-dependent DNA helicase RecG [Bacteroidales bacterium]
MEVNLLDTQIEYLKGVGTKKAEVLRKELGIIKYEDLLYYFPYRYVDKSHFTSISEILSEDVFLQIKGVITNIELVGVGNKTRLVVGFSDNTSTTELIFFKGIKWIKDSLIVGKEYVIFGKPTLFKNSYNFPHPDIEPLDKFIQNQQKQLEKYSPLYNTSEKMKNSFLNSKAISNLVRTLLYQVKDYIPETLPQYIIDRFNLISHREAIINIHFPSSLENLRKAKIRLKFEELFYMQLEHQLLKTFRTERSKGFIFSHIGEMFNTFYNNNLHFQLTNAQKRVVKEIRNDMRTSHQMNRLLQGDVGSGKTLVGLLSMLIAIDNGFQAAMMAPTEILAQQHFSSIKQHLGNMPIEIALLTGATKQKQRKEILPKLIDGTIKIIIGTHSLIEDNVEFHNLGLCVIDEQHRFGVEQRAKMWNKNKIPPHILVMTATPIPRTLAMSVYGDLDCSVIDELPPGRKTIKTSHYFDDSRFALFDFIKKQIKKGRQVYIVYPLIKESEKTDLKDLMDGYESIVRDFPIGEYQISIVHGKMKAEDKEYEMRRFKEGITNIMVSTTVIEVGVDVPNASVMIIENAERFGLSQLHQLRGRVGRGAEQSYCILMTSYRLSKEAKVRIETMCRTNDGFQIAEADLRLRGPGEISGTKQSGLLELKLADIVKDRPILEETRLLAIDIAKTDPSLQSKENTILKQYLKKYKPQTDFSKIS